MSFQRGAIRPKPRTYANLFLESTCPRLPRIHIEQRPPIEATQARGLDPLTGNQIIVQITPDGIGSGEEEWQKVYNPSFDVTPARLISCVVTEKGVAVNAGGEEAIDLSGVC